MNLSFIKLDINILDDQKIKLIRDMPGGNDMIVMWLGLLCIAMKSGRPGVLEVGDGIPYTTEWLASTLGFSADTVKVAMGVFQGFRMIEKWEDGSYYVTNFEKHQELEKIEMGREKQRIRVAKHRENKKLQAKRSDVTVTGALRNTDVTPIDKDIDKEQDIDIDHGFDDFWNLYDKKTGKEKCMSRWQKLSESEKDKIFDALPLYVNSTPDLKYRKNPLTWLNGKHWEDELTNNAPESVEASPESILIGKRISAIKNELFACDDDIRRSELQSELDNLLKKGIDKST
jgi:predicted phage replisome organizer